MVLSSTSKSVPSSPAVNISSGHNLHSGEVCSGGASAMWKGSSYDYTNDAGLVSASGFDSAAETAAPQKPPLARKSEASAYGELNPREFRVSFNGSVGTDGERRSDAGTEDDAVLLCSSNSSFRRKSSLLRSKTKSRLLDQPEEIKPRSQTQRTVAKPQHPGKGLSEIDEDDPFLEEDLPEDYTNLNFNILWLIQLLSLIIIVSSLVCSLTIESWRRKKILQLDLWKWQLMILVLISGRLVAGWAIRIAVFFTEKNFLLRKRVLYFVYGLRNAAQNCVWLGLVLIAWECIFDKKVERVTKSNILPYVTRIWVCLLVGTLIWLKKTLLVKVLASSFHVSTFFDRIQESLFNQYVIETLSGLPVIEMEEEEELMIEVQKLQNAGAAVPPDLKENMFPKRRRLIGTPPTSNGGKKDEHTGITIDHLHRLNQKNISAWKMKRLMNMVRQGVFSTINDKIKCATEEDEALVHITSENQANVAAKKIFFNVVSPGSKYIHQEDLLRFMREDEAMKTLRLFDDCEQKGINKRSLKNWMVNAFRERRALALSLNDTKTAVEKLHYMLNVVVGVMIVVIWLLILKVATTHFFIFLSSQLLLVVFMFGNTCKTSFEAVIFLFVMHPFDVGDRVDVDGVQMVVEEMNILTTVFLKYDNHKIYYPNSVLSTKPIHNYYRSPDMGDGIDFSVHISTPGEKIASMKERITRYVDNRSDHWYPAPMIVLRDMEDMNTLKFSVWLSHKINFQDMGERWARRALLVEEMVKIFSELDIQYRMLPLDVNIRNMPSISSTRAPSNWTTLSGAA